MFALLTLPFKIAMLLVSTVFALLRSLLGLVALLLNPFVLIILIVIIGGAYFL